MISLDLKTTKIQLAQFILSSKNESLINKISSIVKEEGNDFWMNLTESQKKEVEISREQIKNNETESWDSLKSRLNGN